MWRAGYFVLLGAALLLMSCAEDDVETATVAPPTVDVADATALPEQIVTVAAPNGVSEEGYWTGGDWPELPVYSLTYGISQAAHDHFEACGAGDDQIEELARLHIEQASEAITLSSRMVVSALGQPGATPTFSRVMTIERLVPGVYVVTCERQ